MGIVLFTLIGAKIGAGTAYWICFAVYCLIWLIKFVAKVIKE